jgi:acyl-CoA dehydrogenase family protein 9
MSSKEQSFTKALFFGVVAEDLVFPFPQLAPEERREAQELVDRVRRFIESEVDSASIDRDGRIDARVLERMRELGLFGLTVPTIHGGKGLSTMAFSRVVGEIAALDATLALVVLVHNALGVGSVKAYGDERLQRETLPRMASGERIASFALTEDSFGTDAGLTRTQAVPVAAGGWTLSGSKPWVTNAAYAGLFTVFARTSRFEEGHKPQLGAFLVERDERVSVGEPLGLLGLRGAGVSRVAFSDARVPAHHLLGEPGKGYKVAMSVMTDARVPLAAWSFGQLRTIVSFCVTRVQERRSFGRAIGEFPILKNKVAKMLADAYAVESMTFLSAGLMDRGVEDYSVETAICRVAASEALWRSVNEAMQIAAAAGFDEGLGLERRMRDARGGLVVDATNETLRCFIALAGLRGPGERMQDVEGAIYEPVKGFGLLRDFALRKVREAIRRERVTRAHPLLAREAVLFEEATDELCHAAERALREHGREIAEMQQTQVRLANALIDLYALAACLSRTTLAVEQRGEGGARRELDLTSMFASAARGRMHANLGRLEKNDDVLRKVIASRAYTDGGYPFDVL